MLDRQTAAGFREEISSHASPVWPLRSCHVPNLDTSETSGGTKLLSTSVVVSRHELLLPLSDYTHQSGSGRSYTSYNKDPRRPSTASPAQLPSQGSTIDSNLDLTNKHLRYTWVPSRKSSLTSLPRSRRPRCHSSKRPRPSTGLNSLPPNRFKTFSSIDEMLAYSSTSDLIHNTANMQAQTPSSSKSSSRRSSAAISSPPASVNSSPRPRARRRPTLPEQYIAIQTAPATHFDHPESSYSRHRHTSISSPLITPSSPNTTTFSEPQAPSKRPSLQPHAMSWTSHETRAREYAKIDRAHSGVRGFLRRLLPGSCFRDGYRKFWNHDRNGHDDGEEDWDARSVRRYRLDIPGDMDMREKGE